MKRIDWVISISIGLIMGLLAVTTGFAQSFLIPSTVKAERPVDIALRTILTSHARWHSVQGEATFVWYSEDGSTQTYINKFALVQPDKVYVDVIDETGLGIAKTWISDGEYTYSLEKAAKKYNKSAFRQALRDTSYLPAGLTDVKPNEVKLHPLAMIIDAPIREYIFSSWFPQGRDSDTYTLDKDGDFLGRKVWVVELSSQDKQNVSTVWVDKTTGIILKCDQWWGGKPFLNMQFTSFDVNGKIDPSLFTISSDFSPASK